MSVTPVTQLEALRRQIAATHARFAALGARLAQAAEAVLTSGSLPADALLREVHDAAHEFHVVRAAVLDAAASLEVLPPAEKREIASLRDLAPLMDAVVRAADQAARRRQLDAARATAFAVLNRVPAIVHRDQPAFGPLVACHDKARALRAAITGAVPIDLELEARAWARAVTPFAALLTLVEGPPAADDARWSELEETVAAAFGPRLATAAARGMLTLA
jgi:hypothetical protein